MKTLRHVLGFWMLSLAAVSLIVGSTGCGEERGAKGTGPEQEGAAEAERIGFYEEVEQVLEKKMEFVEKLAEEPLIIKAGRENNHTNLEIRSAEILRLDDKWKETEGLDDFIKSFITNECAQLLVDFQEANEGFPEIFVTDEKGLIVAETNRTSDYYQADEDWWFEAYDEGRGKSFHGEIEYDESARTEAISLYVPVMDTETKGAIGVMKAICDITAIKMEL